MKTRTIYVITPSRARYKDGKVSGSPALRSYTIGALIATGHASMTAGGKVSPKKTGSTDLLRAAIGKTAFKYWTKKGWLKEGRLTASGAATCTESVQDEKARTKADRLLARNFANAIGKGGSVTFGDATWNFASEVTISE